MVEGMRNLSYEERLLAVDLPTLQERARTQDLIQLYRIMKNIDDVDHKILTKVIDLTMLPFCFNC